LYTRYEVLVIIKDHMIAAVGERKVRLRLRANRADNVRAERPRPLTREQTDAAGSSVDQHPKVLLDFECFVQEVPDRQPLQHQNRTLLVGDVVGQLYELFRRD